MKKRIWIYKYATMLKMQDPENCFYHAEVAYECWQDLDKNMLPEDACREDISNAY